MIFHASIEADDPARVASLIARLWDGEVFAFPPVAEGSLIVLAGDHRNSAVEIYPRGTELHPTDGDPVGLPGERRRHGPVHLAIATPLEVQAVLQLVAAEGWLGQVRRRGGMFDVVEVWIEDSLMVEVLTPPMQAEYLAAMTPDGWRAALAAQAQQDSILDVRR